MLNILKLSDLVEGLVFCDYTVPEFSCKPEAAFYQLVRPWSNLLPKRLPYVENTGLETSKCHRSV